MPAQTLSELDKSKLLNEFELMPGEDKLRIRRATDSGKLLCDAHERDIQRALLARMPWVRWGSVLLYAFVALTTWMGLADGHRSGWFSWLAATGFTMLAATSAYRWWAARRLGLLLGVRDESTAKSPASR